MHFSWDPAKNRRNIAGRGLDFASAAAMWASPMAVWIDTRQDYGEVRQIGLGIVAGRVMVVGWVERGDGLIHIFTFRKANARETRRYHAHLSAIGVNASILGQPAAPGSHELGARRRDD
jgi:uncharacterized DUF497 family protein